MANDRQGFIGGSDVAAILGLSPYGSPWSVWAEKVGLGVAERSDEMDERLELGKDAEQFLAAVFNRHHVGLGVEVRAGQCELEHVEWPWLRGHADGIIVDRDTELLDGYWEAKTDRAFTPWDDVPAYYQCQAQTYMMLTGWSAWWFTVGFAGWKVKHYVVLADAEDQALIAKETERFWLEHVLTGTPPEADAHPATTAAIKHVYDKGDDDEVVYADEELHALIASLRTVKADAKATEKVQAELENRIKARLGDHAVLKYGDKVLATWRPQDDTRLDAKALRSAMPATAAKFTTTKTIRKLLIKGEAK